MVFEVTSCLDNGFIKISLLFSKFFLHKFSFKLHGQAFLKSIIVAYLGIIYLKKNLCFVFFTKIKKPKKLFFVHILALF
jgi:hypothetical protein